MLKFTLLLFVLATDAKVYTFSKGKLGFQTYDGYEEPPYTSDPAFEAKSYDKRLYESVKWVSTEYRCITMDLCSGSAFMRLFRYITGYNSAEVNINMTVPVLVSTDLRNASFPLSSYEMSFYIPQKFQENPPQPSDSRVYIQTFPNITVYTKTYSGWSNEFFAERQRIALKRMLNADKFGFDDHMFMVAQYNGPGRIFNRRNEVWISGKEK